MTVGLAMLVVACLGRAPAQTEALGDLAARGEWAALTRAAAELEDPLGRAEWEFHALFSAGDLDAALDAARRGLEHDGEHTGLLQNATVCALHRGDGLAAEHFATRLANRLGADAPADLVAEARRLADLERAAREGERRASWVAGLGLGGAVLAVAYLARRGP